MTDYPCTWWERTDEMSEFVGGMSSPMYRNIETGEKIPSRDLPVGALYVATRAPGTDPNNWPPAGADGLSVVCVLIGNHGPDSRSRWFIEDQAANCTKPTDRDHRCWVRHGTVGEKLTANKAGNTCGAGAGSIYMDGNKWHGFLEDGVLVQR